MEEVTGQVTISLKTLNELLKFKEDTLTTAKQGKSILIEGITSNEFDSYYDHFKLNYYCVNDKIEFLKKFVENATSRNKSLIGKLRELKKENKYYFEFEKQVSNLRVRIEKKEESISSYKKSLESARSEHQAKEEELNSLRDMNIFEFLKWKKNK